VIPQRIALRGFLCYRDEQEIALDGASLWMLSGLNGSGKSAIFDAVTYALFGGHRGGQTGAQALINKHSNSFTVEFDFLLDTKLYQARRTLKLNTKGGVAGTQQIRRYLSESAGQERWQALPDTSNKAGFDAWIRQNIGFTYETFTSSVLLMQGKAEKLLSAAPRERFEVLAGIVDLDRYQKLHQKVDSRRRDLQSRAETLQLQLAACPQVSDTELEQAELQVQAARADLQQAQEEVARLQRLELQADRWNELRKKLAETQQQWQQAQGLLRDAESIERDGQRLSELQSVLPHLETIAEQQSRLVHSASIVERFTSQRGELARQVEALDASLKQFQEMRVEQARRAAEEEERQQTVAAQLQALSLAALSLRQLHRARTQLQQARQRAEDIVQRQGPPTSKAQRLEAELQAQTRKLEAATELRTDCDHRLTRADTLLQAAWQRAERFYGVVGEKVCRYCGQALTPGHVETEKAKLEQELAAAEAHFREVQLAHEKALCEEKSWQCVRAETEQQFHKTRDEIRSSQQERADAERDATRHTEACLLSYQDLAEPFRSRVGPVAAADWLRTLYPTDDELRSLECQVAELNAETKRLQAGRQARRQEALAGELEQTQRQKAFESRQRQQAELDRQLAEENVRREASQEIVASAVAALPASWRPYADSAMLAESLPNWQTEKADLLAKQADTLLQELRRVQASVEPLRLRKTELEAELDTIPEEARCHAGQFRDRVAQVRLDQTAKEEQFVLAQQTKQRLVHERDQRSNLEKDFLQVERQHKLHALLAELLGRNRLQLSLVRRAERGIVDYANAALDRISAGQLYLRLRCDNEDEDSAEHALQLEAFNRTAGQSPIGVPFLSGSQRFRVAVSLALGIGQYASRQHRPIESVIIDEGFGCLDRQGRQVMIQELNNLKGQLRCILLVSHQEEFADAFPDGYRCELVDGTAVATRFQR
jgi:DNA repair exonuclease SbcCD ATPase subunit